MPKPVRDPAHLAFIRTLPCSVCPRDRTIEAAHVGRHGMSQKSSDRETIPLCSLHHREQHRIGLKRFARDYNLDIPAMLRDLNERPRIRIAGPEDALRVPVMAALVTARFLADYRDDTFLLLPVALGVDESIELAKRVCREYLIETVFKNRVFR